MVNSVAAQKGWTIFTADVSQAFLGGLTFEQAAQIKGEVQRQVQFKVPPGIVAVLKQLSGYEDYDPMTEVLNMLRCAFGVKDAPRLWQVVLFKALLQCGLKPLQSDEKLYIMYNDGEMQMILSSHVDDLKGAASEEARAKLIKALEYEFGKLKANVGNFECVGIMHQQDPTTKEIWTHQMHYIQQLIEIDEDEISFANDEELVSDKMHTLFMSLVGGMAWLTLTCPCICIYAVFLQRCNKAFTVGHVKSANRLLRWMKKNKAKLGVKFNKLRGPLETYGHI